MREFSKWWEVWVRWVIHLNQGLILWIMFIGSWYWRPRWIMMDWFPDSLFRALFYHAASGQMLFYGRYALNLFILALLLLWALTLFRGVGNITRDGRLWWVMALLALLGIIWLSFIWVNPAEGGNQVVALSHMMQWAFVVFFAIAVVAIGPAPRWIALALVAGALFQGGIGIVQSYTQSDLGIRQIDEEWLHIGLHLAEFRLDPEESGVSIVEAEGVRFLRAYGLTSHPNVLGGVLVMGLVSGLWLWQREGKQSTGGWLTVLLLWALLLTFSRAAIGGFGVGVGMVGLLFLLGRYVSIRGDWQKALAFGLIVLAVGGLFYLVYQPFVSARAGTADTDTATVEDMSIASREYFTEQAQELIEENGWVGVGIGNFPWISHRMIREDPRDIDLRGDNVHNIYLLVLAELGYLGGGLALLVIGLAGLIIFQNWRQNRLAPAALCLWGGVSAWLAIGLFDHYPWTLFPQQIVLWGAMAGALIPVKAFAAAKKHKESEVMEVIDLNQNWRYRLVNDADVGRYSAYSIEVDDWEIISLRNLVSVGISAETSIWLRRTFVMPLNEQCSTWWIEADGDFQGEVWVNGQPVGHLSAAPLEITSLVAMGDNMITMRIDALPAQAPASLACVPYPCQ